MAAYTGSTIAYDAASRGLRTALIDAADFGSGASFNHQKTAHGGLRSLQTGRIDRARESIDERRALARIAPWFLRPLPFLTGTYRSLIKNRVALRAAFKLDAWLGRKRNEGVEPELHLPAPKLISKAATLRLFSGINPSGLTGGAQWYDYQMVENDRLTLAFAAAADKHGADVVNYVVATDALKDADRVVGMQVRDRENGREFAIKSQADRQRGRRARGRDHADLRSGPSVSAAESDQPGHIEAGERHRPGGADGGRPHADADPLAGSGGDRHRSFRDAGATG